MLVTHKLTVDLTRGGEMPRIDVVQGDVYTRAVELTLMEEGVPFPVPSGTAAVVRYRKKDGTGGVYDTMPDGSLAYSIRDNVVTVYLVPQMMTCTGGVTAEVALSNSGAILGIFPMRIWVELDPSVDTVQSEDYFGFDSLETINAALAGYSSSITSLRSDSTYLAKWLALEHARINELAHLEQGSTTGDAELADIRVGVDCATYETAGEAVRKQIGDIQSDLYSQRTEFLISPDAWEGMIDKSDSSAWISSKKYKSGTLKGASVYVLGDTAQDVEIQIYKDNGDNTATLYAGVGGSGVGLVELECDIYIDRDFYVAVKAPNGAYKKVDGGAYYVKSVSETACSIPDSSGRKLYHAYALKMLPFADEKVDQKTLADTRQELIVRMIKTAEQTIRTGTEYADVIALPANRIYSIHNDVDPVSFGLPAKGYGTLLKYRPYTDDKGDTGYDVYDFTVLNSAGSFDRYFAYAVPGQTAQNLVWRKNGTDLSETGILNRTVKTAEQTIRTGTEYADVIALPPNRIYSIHNNVDPASFGLPAKGYGTLLKYRPYTDDKGDTGYDVYDFTVYKSADSIERYFAYAIAGQTVQSLVWRKISTSLDDAAVLGRTIKAAETTIRTGTEYADVVALPCNRIYSIHNDVDPASFGHPAKGHGTLMKYRPYTDDKGDTGYVVYEHTVYRSAGLIEKYFAYAIAGDTVDTLVWKKLNTTANTESIRKLGLEDKSIVFVGDSIVEGYGSSDYNGGESGTSGHLIENNVKSWYRNTGEKCWANRMIAYLTEYYPGVTACNNGIGGFNVANVYNNLETLTMDDSGNRADVVVLSVGTNARNYEDKYNGITVPLRRIINWLQVRGIQPVILTNSPLYNTEDSLHESNESNARCVRSAIMQACEETGVHCYDMLSRYYEYLWEQDMEVSRVTVMADPLHPNDLGYEIMFHLIKRLLHV